MIKRELDPKQVSSGARIMLICFLVGMITGLWLQPDPATPAERAQAAAQRARTEADREARARRIETATLAILQQELERPDP